MRTDTIAAIATGLSDSGIGIIRISGPDAFAVIRRIFVKKNGAAPDVTKSHTVQYGFIYVGSNGENAYLAGDDCADPGGDKSKRFPCGEKLDEVLVLVMRGPHSYTGEDTVEIDCHGGVLMMRRILETVLQNGARAAEPGEFTKRAFLNGRIDLSQAEAVIDVINAKNDYALKNSVRQLSGRTSEKIRGLREEILYEIAFIESALDDPEHISLDGYREKLREKLSCMIGQVTSLLDSAEYGRLVSEGIRTVIVGKPNVGKSSLLNVLLGEDRAIVTEIAGTTRDILEEQIQFGDIYLRIVDTAGIRDTEDAVEKIGVARAMDALADADLILYVIDASEALDENDSRIMDMIHGRKAIIVLNKSDLPTTTDSSVITAAAGLQDIPCIAVSAREGTGFDKLRRTVQEMFYEGNVHANDEVLITSLRQKEALSEALESLKKVEESIESGLPEDFYSIDLTDAYTRLGSIIGEAVEDDVVNEIFSRFCMGK